MVVHGTFEVDFKGASAGDVCFPGHGYPEIKQGAKVIVLGGDDRLIGRSALAKPSGAKGVCTYDFTITVPSGQSHYSIYVADLGRVRESEKEMRKGPSIWVDGTEDQ
jgi:hypothetical protein